MALIATSALGVLAGGAIAQFVSPKALSLVAGIGFIAIGALLVERKCGSGQAMRIYLCLFYLV